MNLAYDFLGVGESSHLELAEDFLSINNDIEDAAGAFDELGLDAYGLLDFIRQTGGLWAVVSFAAIGD